MIKFPFSHHSITRAAQLAHLLKDGYGVGATITIAGQSYQFTAVDRRNVTLLSGAVEPITFIREYIIQPKRPGRKKAVSINA